MSTPIVVGNLQSFARLSVTHGYSLGVMRQQDLHATNPVTPITGYTPVMTPYTGVKNVPPLPGGSSGGGGTIGFAF